MIIVINLFNQLFKPRSGGAHLPDPSLSRDRGWRNTAEAAQGLVKGGISLIWLQLSGLLYSPLFWVQNVCPPHTTFFFFFTLAGNKHRTLLSPSEKPDCCAELSVCPLLLTSHPLIGMNQSRQGVPSSCSQSHKSTLARTHTLTDTRIHTQTHTLSVVWKFRGGQFDRAQPPNSQEDTCLQGARAFVCSARHISQSLSLHTDTYTSVESKCERWKSD